VPRAIRQINRHQPMWSSVFLNRQHLTIGELQSP
jgi:hypothetical protein